MSEDAVDATQVPRGEEVGDIASGHGNPDAAPRTSDEKAADMLAAEGSDAVSEGSDAVDDGYADHRKLVDRPADSAAPTEGTTGTSGQGGGGASSW